MSHPRWSETFAGTATTWRREDDQRLRDGTSGLSRLPDVGDPILKISGTVAQRSVDLDRLRPVCGRLFCPVGTVPDGAVGKPDETCGGADVEQERRVAGLVVVWVLHGNSRELQYGDMPWTQQNELAALKHYLLSFP